MTKSSLSDMTTKRPKEPLDPALDAPLAVTPDQLEKVAGGLALAEPRIGDVIIIRGGTVGFVPPVKLPPDVAF